jgi:hypothetical protein
VNAQIRGPLTQLPESALRTRLEYSGAPITFCISIEVCSSHKNAVLKISKYPETIDNPSPLLALQISARLVRQAAHSRKGLKE